MSISFEEATQKALNFNSKMNEYTEYNDAWFFYVNDGNEYDGGGYDAVILKEDGKQIPAYLYFMDSKRKIKKIRTGKLNIE